MRDQHWEKIERELRREPRVDPAAVEQVVRRLALPEPRGRLRRVWRWLVRPLTVRVSPLALGAACAAALLVALGPGWPGASREGVLPRSAEVPALQPVQFVLVAERASRVSLVGDFNDWNPAATPLRRGPEGAVWNVVVPLRAGRYRYAFVVDGSRWVGDALAPRGPENEFGLPSSVVLVGGQT